MLTHKGLLLLFFNKLKILWILTVMVNTDRYNCVYNYINLSFGGLQYFYRV